MSALDIVEDRFFRVVADSIISAAKGTSVVDDNCLRLDNKLTTELRALDERLMKTIGQYTIFEDPCLTLNDNENCGGPMANDYPAKASKSPMLTKRQRFNAMRSLVDVEQVKVTPSVSKLSFTKSLSSKRIRPMSGEVMRKSMSQSSGLSIANDSERTTAEAVYELVRGATLLKAVRAGKAHFRFFSLSKDLSRLSWKSPNKKVATVLISEITEIVRGQKTKTFENRPVPEYENFSFSLLYEKRSLDIVCRDQKQFDTWIQGLQALLDGFCDMKAVSAIAQDSSKATLSRDSLQVEFLPLGHAKVHFEEDSCDIYTWGSGERSILGHGEEMDEKVPRVLEALLGRSVRTLALGHAHSMVICEDDDTERGNVYSWGSGQYGRLGHNSLRDRFLPVRIGKPFHDEEEGGLDIVDISCNRLHSAAVTDDGKLFTWGRSLSRSCSRLGYSCTDRSKVPTLVSSLSNVRVTMVSCGLDHTVALTDSSQVFTFGENRHGQLGLGHTTPVDQPTAVNLPDLLPVQKVSCGMYHSAALTDRGEVYMWGFNGDGQCGVSGASIIHSPTLVKAQHIDFELADVACGDNHSAFVNTAGLVFCCGSNLNGQLGLGNQLQKVEYCTPQPISIAGVKVVQVACALSSTAALSDTGHLFTWGSGQNGVLGHGDTKNRLLPTEVQAVSDKKVRSVFCGGNHMAIKVKRGWVPDEEAKKCMMCKLQFTTLRRRHHCRQCGGVFCGNCSSKRYPLLDKGYSDPVRVCERCYALLTQKTGK